MRLTKRFLKRIIKEEINTVLKEGDAGNEDLAYMDLTDINARKELAVWKPGEFTRIVIGPRIGEDSSPKPAKPFSGISTAKKYVALLNALPSRSFNYEVKVFKKGSASGGGPFGWWRTVEGTWIQPTDEGYCSGDC
jgi:hypothetical protein